MNAAHPARVVRLLAAALLAATGLGGCEWPRFGADDIPADPGPPALREHAVAFAEGFLARVDAGAVDATWDEVATSLQERAGRATWNETLRSMRRDVGPLVERELRRYGYAEELEDAPPGVYFVLDFDTQFARRALAERVVCALENDEHWRVAGYFAVEPVGR